MLRFESQRDRGSFTCKSRCSWLAKKKCTKNDVVTIVLKTGPDRTGRSDRFNREPGANPVRLKPPKPVKNRAKTGVEPKIKKKNDWLSGSVFKTMIVTIRVFLVVSATLLSSALQSQQLCLSQLSHSIAQRAIAVVIIHLFVALSYFITHISVFLVFVFN